MGSNAHGKCNYCGKSFSVVEWYDRMDNADTMTETPWTCPGCGQKLKTSQIEIFYIYEGYNGID